MKPVELDCVVPLIFKCCPQRVDVSDITKLQIQVLGHRYRTPANYLGAILDTWKLYVDRHRHF
jgi:hypothetical protein